MSKQNQKVVAESKAKEPEVELTKEQKRELRRAAKKAEREKAREERKAQREKDKANKPAKVMYPGLEMGQDGEATKKLKEWPTDYDPEKHLRLRKKDFEDEVPFMEKRAERLEKKAKEIRAEIDVIRKSGGKTESKKLKKFAKMAGQFKELMGELSSELSPEQLAEFTKMFSQAAPSEDKDKDKKSE